MNDLSSEKIAKALKGAGLSVDQRIATATEAWTNDQLFFPNKDDFLFEWLCSALTKKVKSSADCAALQIAYWQLLHKLLGHYTHRTEKKSPPAIRVPLITAVTTLLSQLSTLQNQHEILLELYACVDLLLSPTFALSYRPKFEQMSGAVDQLVDTLSAAINSADTQITGALSQVAMVLLKQYNSQLVQSANQRKTFATIVEKPFEKFLCIRRRLTGPEYAQPVSAQITEILVNVLFHPDVIIEYTSVLKDQTNAKQAAYVWKLFDELSKLLEDGTDEDRIMDALDVLPVLFNSFVHAFRKKRANTSSQDIDRQVEFGFFTECRVLLNKVQHSSSFVETLSRLVQELVQLNVYVARNDDISRQQYEALENIAETTVFLLKDQSKSSFQRSILDLANVILKVDYSLIEGRMATLWPYMISPEKDAEDACLEFAISVLQTYTASRQIDAYIDDLINALQNLSFQDVYALLKKPVFSRRFMDEFSAVISKHLPAAQAPDIFDRFARAIQESIEPKTNGSATKKQKHEHHSIPKHRPTARFISIFLSHFINSVKLTQHQRQALEQPAKALFENFIRRAFDPNCDTEARVVPALQIHSSLMNTMSDIYWGRMDNDTHEWLGKALRTLFVAYTKAESQSYRVAVVLSANALLQHAYFAYVIGSNQNQASPPLVSIVGTVLDFVLDQSSAINFEATWDGSLLAIDDSAVKIACWKLLADEWFDVISRFSDGERGRKLTNFVLHGLLEPSASQPLEASCLTLRSISEHLLRSANFYEAQCFKEHALSVILDSFATFIHSKADKNLAQCYANFQDFASGAEELAQVVKSSNGSKMTTETVKKAMQYLDQLLIFPMEYYTKSDRHKVIWMAFLVDTLAGVATKANNEARGKVHLLSRTLLLRLFASQNSGNILEMNADLLSWFLSSVSFDSDSVLARAVKERTKQLDDQVLRSLLSMVISKGSNAGELLNHSYKTRIEWLKNAQPNAEDWIIDMIQVINEILHRHGSKDGVAENVCPSQLIRELSQFVIKSLNEAKARISATIDKPDATNVPIDSSLLVLVSLLQEYAQLRGSQGNELVDIGALSKVMVALASPCTALLQRSLRSPSSSEHTAVMKMTTAFVGSLCKVLSRYQHVYVTERVFALIWFIYSMVYTSDKHCAKSLCLTFSSWIGTLSNEQFAAVTQGFIEQSNRLVTQATDKDRKVYLSLLIEMLHGATSEQKSWLRQYVPALVTKLSAISRGTENVGFVHKALEFLAALSSEQSLRTSAYDVSLILACLVQVANPPQIEKFEHVNRETAHALFHAICDVLQNLLLHHRQQLVDIMAPFIATLQALLYCFRSPHLALVTKKRKAGSTETATQKFALISMSAPLDVTAADRVARIFNTMAKKSGGNSKRQQRYTGLQQYRIISRHAPFLLIEYFTIQSNVAMSISQPQIKSVLETGLYNMMDMTSEIDRNMVLAALDASGKLLFKNFYTSWKENHMYTGQ